jgi:hypothetical protein
MDKSDLLRSMREGHESIAAAVAALTDEELREGAPGMPGWTRKDVLAHIEWWHRHSAAVLGGLRTGADPYPDEGEGWDIDTHNARVLAENRDRSSADVRAGEAASFAELWVAVESATDHELFDEGVQPWFGQSASRMVGGDTWDHYPEHVPHLVS